MGYYTQIRMNLKVKKDKIEEFKAKLREMKEKLEKCYKSKTIDEGEMEKISWFSYYDDLEVDEEGNLIFSEYYRKFYDFDKFAEFIKDYVEEGAIECFGEEFGDVYALYFDGKGNYEELDYYFISVKTAYLFLLTIEDNEKVPFIFRAKNQEAIKEFCEKLQKEYSENAQKIDDIYKWVGEKCKENGIQYIELSHLGTDLYGFQQNVSLDEILNKILEKVV